MNPHERMHVIGSALAALTLWFPAATAAAQAEAQAADPTIEQDAALPVEPGVSDAQDEWSADGATTMTGELHSYRRLDLRGRADGHTLVKVRLKDGRARIVDLGSRATPSALVMHRGERVRLQGRMERVGGLSVLLAERITLESGDVLVPSALPAGDVGSFQPASYSSTAAPVYPEPAPSDAPIPETIAGRIEGSWRFPFGGTDSAQTLVKLTIENNLHVIADFGSERTLELIDPKSGDVIWMRGVHERIDGVPIFLVEEVSIDEATDIRPERDVQED